MYNVKITVENLKVLNDRCTGKFKIFKNIIFFMDNQYKSHSFILILRKVYVALS